jgi:MFS family permease
MLFCFILLIAALLWLQVAEALWMLFFFAAIYGVAHGGFFTPFSPVVAEFFGIKSHGALFGIAMFSGTFGGAIGPFWPVTSLTLRPDMVWHSGSVRWLLRLDLY